MISSIGIASHGIGIAGSPGRATDTASASSRHHHHFHREGTRGEGTGEGEGWEQHGERAGTDRRGRQGTEAQAERGGRGARAGGSTDGTTEAPARAREGAERETAAGSSTGAHPSQHSVGLCPEVALEHDPNVEQGNFARKLRRRAAGRDSRGGGAGGMRVGLACPVGSPCSGTHREGMAMSRAMSRTPPFLTSGDRAAVEAPRSAAHNGGGEVRRRSGLGVLGLRQQGRKREGSNAAH